MRRPPLPHEHGAWIMLYAPLVIGSASSGRFAAARMGALIVAVTGLYLAREAAGRLLRRRRDEGALGWLALFVAFAAGGAVPLLQGPGGVTLLAVGAVAAGLFLVHSLLLVAPSRRRLDRSVWGELLAVAALSLTAPAARITSLGAPDGVAWWLWLACALFFCSSIFYVKMLLAAVKVKGDGGGGGELAPRDRWRLGTSNLSYHALMVAGAVGLALSRGGFAGGLVLLGFAPALARALAGTVTLRRTPPPLKRVGMWESLYSLWFMACLIAAARP